MYVLLDFITMIIYKKKASYNNGRTVNRILNIKVIFDYNC